MPARKKTTSSSKSKPKSGGRKKALLTQAQVTQVEKLASMGMDQNSIIFVIGINRRTFFRRKKDQAELAEAIERGKAVGLQKATKKLFELIQDKNLGALCFYLKAQHGWREARRIEHTGKDGGPIKTKSKTTISNRELAGMTNEQLEELIDNA